MTYIECPECGQKALAVATRCPRCGFNFPPQSSRRRAPNRGSNRLRPVLAAAGGLAAAGLVLVAILSRSRPRPAPPAPLAAPAEATVDTVEVAAEPAPQPSVSPTAPGVRRYARTWVNVRADRRRSSATVRVLKPGEAVLVDSLKRGWWRVLVDGRPIGYAHYLNLDRSPAQRSSP